MVEKQVDVMALLEPLNEDFGKELREGFAHFSEEEWSKILPKESTLSREEIIHEVVEAIPIREMEETVVKGMELVNKELFFILSTEERKKFQKEVKELVGKFKQGDVFRPQGVCVAKQFGLTPHFLMCIHKIGAYYLVETQFTEALTVFNLLVLLCPYISQVWISLGHTQSSLGLYEESNLSYLAAGLVNPKADPTPLLHMARNCHREKKDEEAKRYFSLANKVLETSENPADYKPLFTSIEREIYGGTP